MLKCSVSLGVMGGHDAKVFGKFGCNGWNDAKVFGKFGCNGWTRC